MLLFSPEPATMNIPEPVLEGVLTVLVILMIGRLFSLMMTGIGVIAILIFGPLRTNPTA